MKAVETTWELHTPTVTRNMYPYHALFTASIGVAWHMLASKCESESVVLSTLTVRLALQDLTAPLVCTLAFFLGPPSFYHLHTHPSIFKVENLVPSLWQIKAQEASWKPACQKPAYWKPTCRKPAAKIPDSEPCTNALDNKLLVITITVVGRKIYYWQLLCTLCNS